MDRKNMTSWVFKTCSKIQYVPLHYLRPIVNNETVNYEPTETSSVNTKKPKLM